MSTPDRPPLRFSPQRRQTPNRQTHSGMIFQDGRLHVGGRLHGHNGPKPVHDLLSPVPGIGERSPIYMCSGPLNTKHESLPSTREFTPRRRERPESPIAGPTGRKHCDHPSHGNLIAHEQVASVARTPERKPSWRVDSPLKVGHHIPGIATECNLRLEKTPHSGRRYYDGPPSFEPEPFQKRPYHCNLRRVDTKPPDCGIFSFQPDPFRQQTPVKSGRMRVAPPGQERFDIISNLPGH